MMCTKLNPCLPHTEATELMLHVNGRYEKGEIRFGIISEGWNNSLEVKNSSPTYPLCHSDKS